VTGGTRRKVSGALFWAPALAALTLGSAVVAVRFREDLAWLGVSLAATAIVAAAFGIALERRVHSARSLALRDPLTGLPNRTLLDDRIEQALRRARRTEERFAVVLIDLDGFKDVNDVRGHRAGDAVLVTLARRFESVVRASDTVARVGGDEFVVLSLGTGDDDEAAALVGRLRHALRRPFQVEGATVEVDASVGWSLYPDDGATPDELRAHADGQMYATKRDTNDDSALQRRPVDAGIVRDIETALERNEMIVVFQPILDLRSSEPRGAEALVRRNHPELGLLPPAEFVPHVERTPLARELTFLVVAESLRAIQLWAGKGHELGVSVNLPYRLLDDPKLVEGLEGLFETFAIDPVRLTLEIIPAGPGAGAELDDSVVKKLRALGVRLSLDDVGRAASFAALRVLPLDEIKIDAAFVHGLGRNERDAALVHGMVTIGHKLGLDVVAEGVETREAWKAVAALGCDLAQGFYVATGTSPEVLADWLDGRWPAVA
jgi:diguanylate cyclase